MKKSIAGLVSGLAGFQTTAALANVGEGPPDYSGITALYYVLIAVVLIFGVYDTFFKKS
jgi:hypothetical protein